MSVHVDEAKRVLADGRAAAAEATRSARAGCPDTADAYGKKAHGCWMQAQAEATLALVEQQRIANLMAYIVLIGERPGAEDDTQIREALGL